MFFRFILLFIGILIFSGCKTVVTSKPLVEKGEILDQQKFEGSWIVDNYPAAVRYNEDGNLEIATLRKGGDAFKVIRGTARIIKGKDHNFMSINFIEGEESKGYYLAAYKFSDAGDLIVWPANHDYLAKLVMDKKLKGKVVTMKHSSEVVITDDAEKILTYINQAGDLNAFYYKEPWIFRKTGK